LQTPPFAVAFLFAAKPRQQWPFPDFPFAKHRRSPPSVEGLQGLPEGSDAETRNVKPLKMRASQQRQGFAQIAGLLK